MVGQSDYGDCFYLELECLPLAGPGTFAGKRQSENEAHDLYDLPS